MRSTIVLPVILGRPWVTRRNVSPQVCSSTVARIRSNFILLFLPESSFRLTSIPGPTAAANHRTSGSTHKKQARQLCGEAPFFVEWHHLLEAIEFAMLDLGQDGIFHDRVHETSAESGVAPSLFDNDVEDHRLIDTVGHRSRKADELFVDWIDEGKDDGGLCDQLLHVILLPTFGPPFLLKQIGKLIDLLSRKRSPKLKSIFIEVHTVVLLSIDHSPASAWSSWIELSATGIPDCNAVIRVAKRRAPGKRC